MECKGEEDETVDQTYRLSLQRENSRGNVQGKHLPSDTLSKNPMDGSKVDKDISGKLLHGKPSQPPRLKSKPFLQCCHLILFR